MVALPKDLPTISFADAKKWRAWLTKNHTSSQGLWMKIAKKGAAVTSVSYAAALDEALCFGWIDGQKKSLDDTYYLQRFTPRRPRSIWSKINIGHIARLIQEEKMMPAGLAEVDKAKADGRWEQAYDSPSSATVPDDLLAALSKNKKAKDFFATLNKSQLYSIIWRLQTCKKPETRLKRIKEIVAMLARKQSF